MIIKKLTFLLTIIGCSILVINFAILSFFSEWGNGVLFALTILMIVSGVILSLSLFKDVESKPKLSMLAVTITVFFIVLMPRCIIWGEGLIHYIRFKYHEETYLNEVSKADKTILQFVKFSWGGFMMNPTILVFDESDELSLPGKAKTEKWWSVVGKDSEFGVCNWDAEKISGHFYVVNFSC